MQKITRELEDLKNSQTSVLKKIAQIEADNIQISNKTLEDILPDVHESVDESITKVTELVTKFEEETAAFKEKHKLEEDPTAV